MGLFRKKKQRTNIDWKTLYQQYLARDSDYLDSVEYHLLFNNATSLLDSKVIRNSLAAIDPMVYFTADGVNQKTFF